VTGSMRDKDTASCRPPSRLAGRAFLRLQTGCELALLKID
jgi:hypothetical protein